MARNSREAIESFQLRVTDTDGWKVASDGILARNKGFQPHQLVCAFTNSPDSPAETISPLYPRVSKKLRGRARSSMEMQYGGLGSAFDEAATELNLLMRDFDTQQLYNWL